MAKKKRGKAGPYLGIDIGGTKIQVSLVEESGRIRGRERVPTPQEGGHQAVLDVLFQAINKLLDEEDCTADELAAIGVAVPGVVDPKRGYVVVTPNMSLSGVDIGPRLERHFGVPVCVGNDCNLGTLGECWLGAARNAKSAVGIFVGTGIGAGFVRKGKIWRGAREAACEIGHIVMQIGGPLCGCGNRGCLEALASRSAIERQLREAIEQGRQSALPELSGGDLSRIRSKVLRRALEAGDELVEEVLRRAAETIGYACLTVRHLIDPEVIVLGGGVMEACGYFMMPIIQEIIASDKLPGARPGGYAVLSALEDDAVVLGAVALARRHIGRNPFKKKYAVLPSYPKLSKANFGQIIVDGDLYDCDVFIRADGKVKRRDKSIAKEQYGTSHRVGLKEIRKVCKGGPEIVFIASGHSAQLELDEQARQYMEQRQIEYQILPTPEAVQAYNNCKRRKAALIHVTC